MQDGDSHAQEKTPADIGDKRPVRKADAQKPRRPARNQKACVCPEEASQSNQKILHAISPLVCERMVYERM